MKMSFSLRLISCAAVALLLPMSVFAHTALKESTPSNEAVVTTPPGHINLVFTEDVRLIKLEVMGVGHEMPTKFEAQSAAMASYSVETPGMHPGEFTVNWAVIGADGHTVTDTFTFLVDPDAEESHGAHGEEGHSHDGDGDHSH